MVLCPHCGGAIALEDINVAKDVALCRACEKPFSISGMVRSGDDDLPERAPVPAQVNLAAPPPGAFYHDDGVEMIVGATVRSIATGVFFLLFALGWNAVSWPMFLSSFGIGPFAGSSSQPSGGGTVTTLFMIPFLVIGAGVTVFALVCWLGVVRVTIRGENGTVFTGIGRVGWTRRFKPADVTAIAIERSTWHQNNRIAYHIILKGPDLTFGTGLTSGRREFIAAVLRRQLVG